ncbi:hypothetical protein ACPXCP_21830 [Streptomyces sp. DT20]|uniref:hypothetical protein n=1 Tax=unclassified Streptomyces TaxID=2593676 RepID=UPI00093A0798|nr:MULTISPECIES: hypothetical protein [unclassified Streptomyces]WRZ12757.1 hypothetical protein OG892_19230 [Streptomyces sp. NBC_00341]WSJ23730.1 hypothetical protein OG384_17945 [Streptomyces sp. NBC_01324]
MPEPAPPSGNPPADPTPAAPPSRPALAYEEVTEPGYPVAYTACLRIEPTGDGAVLTGTCPRCRCTMVYTWTRSVVRAASRTRRRRTGTGLVAVPVLCVCVTGHPGRPDDEEGCGAYWNIQLERERR